MAGAKTTTGINVRHGKACATRAGRPCDCIPSYQAEVYDALQGRKVRRTFPTRGAASTPKPLVS